ncbi:hypothetical protein scyTo_0006376 [Scyliorhinus torazame]|uniref:PEP-utilising enzyme mobile domain-containing protein n=1 Tax=Scyliorhinus torazame TaxID=75743 RepID=A0A401PHG7_SCYTO|nr:hypothetical protein [Scyliorhinus torazame]
MSLSNHYHILDTGRKELHTLASMISLFLLVSVFLCIYVVKNLLQEDPEPLNGRRKNGTGTKTDLERENMGLGHNRAEEFGIGKDGTESREPGTFLGSSSKEMECVPNLLSHPQHPVHPDAIVREESEKCWSGGGLKLECLEPYQRWRIFFNGLLRKGSCRHEWSEEEGELIHVKFGFIWSAFSRVFDFETDIHPRALARAIAKEKWNRRFIGNMNINVSGRQVPDVVPTGKFQEPVVPECLRLVLALSEEMCQCAALVGSKGAQLAQLIEMQKRFGYQMQAAIVNRMPNSQLAQTEGLQTLDDGLIYLTLVDEKSQTLRCVELFRKTKLAPEIENAIHNQLEELRLLGAEERLAVRSSAVWEDTEDTSAAGQLETKLGLKGFEQSVVSGSVMPDTITLSHSRKGPCQIIRKEMGTKKQQIKQAAEGGIVYEDILTLQAAQCCISEDIILRLGQVALQIQKAYGNPRDIEWAIKDTDIYLLQARPVTTLDIESEFELMHEFDSALCTNFVWMTTSNVSEMLPGAVTPLSMSTFIRAVDYALQEIMSKFGTAHHVFPCGSSFIMTCCGHLFINLLTSYKVVESHLLTEKNEFDLSIRGSVLKEATVEDAIFIHGRTSFWRKIMNSMKVFKFLLTGKRNARFLEKKLKIYQVPPANTAKLFYRNIDRELPEFYKGWITSISVSAKSTVWTNIVMHCFPKQKHMYNPEMMLDLAVLYSTCPDVLSADIPTYLEAIVELIKTQGKVNTFLEMDTQNAVSWLLSQQSGVIGQKFQKFLEKHGYRCLREAELHEKSWASEPSKIIPAIQAALQKNKPIAKKIKMSSDDSIASIKSPLSEIQKLILRLALPKARNAVATRELGKSMGIKMTDVFKRAYWKLANLMVQEGFLPDEDLLFFLTHSEIGKLLLHRSPALISRAQRRKRLLGKQMLLTFLEVNSGKPVPIDHHQSGTIGDQEAGLTLTGLTVSQGIVKGTARVVKTILEADCIQQGDILIVTNTDIGWSPYFPLLGGLVTEIGGLISHGAVVAREYGLPCIVSCVHATSLFRSGDFVILNAEKGFVQKVEATENASCG